MKILVVEDDIMLADFLEEVLQDLGHTVCAITGLVDEAVRLVREHRPDLALVDMQLRDGAVGTDIAELLDLSNDLGEMGILYVSGEADRVQKVARFGHACLSKPYSVSTLTSALTIVLQVANGTPWSDAMPPGMKMISGSAAGISIVQST